MQKNGGKNLTKEEQINTLIKCFLSEKFEFNKKNLNLLFNALHELEYNYFFEKTVKIAFYDENSRTYKEMENKGSAQFCDARRDYRKQTMKILFNTKEYDLLDKWRILASYFHESEHEKQLDNICSKFRKNISDYEHLIRFSYIWGQELYHSEIIEIEAMISEANKTYETLKNNPELISKESIYLLICELLEIENCLNYFENEEVFEEIYKKYGKELKNRGISFSKFEINSKKIIELHSIVYDNKFLFWRNKRPITIADSEYKEKLQKILDKKITKCYNNVFKLIYQNAIELYKPRKNDEKTLSKENYKTLLTLNNKSDIIELLYNDLADKFEDFEDSANEKEIIK